MIDVIDLACILLIAILILTAVFIALREFKKVEHHDESESRKLARITEIKALMIDVEIDVTSVKMNKWTTIPPFAKLDEAKRRLKKYRELLREIQSE